jgi:tRNA dimethylallyltransferase
MARGDLQAELPAMRCVGYRQAWQLLEQQALGTPLTASQTQALRDTGIAATRQLAKRQLTWLRSMPQRHVVQADDSHALAQLLNLVTLHWGAP